MSRHAYDVAVVGAGPVGLATALGFAQAGRSVRLAGPAPVARDGRTAALLQGSLGFLSTLGVDPARSGEAAPLRVMTLVDDTGSLFRPPPVAFRADEIGLDAFGWNIENATLAGLLAEAVRATPAIVWTDGLADGLDGPGTILLETGEQVTAALVVGADGRNSRIRDAAGLRTRRHAYPQRALTTLLRHERDHDDVSTEFHTRAGPFTLVPLPGRRSSLVWVTSPHHAARLAALDDAGFARAVERRSRDMLGRVEVDGPRGSVPLALQSVDRLIAPRLALVGEAAHVLPPIGAQGLNLGFSDAAALLGFTLAADDGDLGAEPALRRYEHARRGDIRLRSTAVDGLNRALLSDLLPVDALRGLGLGLLANVGPLRRAVMRAGLVGRMRDGSVSARTGMA